MQRSRHLLVSVGLAIFAFTAWLYWPGVHGQYLFGDDLGYLQQAEHWQGLTWNAVKWSFTSTESYYQPLIRLSLVLDYQIWGANPAGSHAVNIFLHAFNTVLVFGFLWTLLGAASLKTTERFLLALWTALVFAIHPLQVESVVWISARTQLLCTLFCAGSLWAYAAGSRGWLVWGLYLLALLCKPLAVSLPFVMLAMDYYPLRRHEKVGWRFLLKEKALWLAITGAMALATMLTKAPGSHNVPLATIPFGQRILFVFQSLMFYVWKLIWPGHISPYYPLRLGLSLTQWPILFATLSAILITALALIKRRSLPLLVSAWATYAVLILPVSGLIPTVWQSVAARYAYVAILPLLLAAGAGVVWVSRRSKPAVSLVLVCLLAGQLCLFGIGTRQLIPAWHDDVAEWNAVLVEFPDLDMAHRLLAAVLLSQGRAAEALPHAQRDAELRPQQYVAQYKLGLILASLGKFQAAIPPLQSAVRIDPTIADGHSELANALFQTGQSEAAEAEYEHALRINPDFTPAREALTRLHVNP